MHAAFPPKDATVLASMGLYIFNRDVLVELLDNDHEDFGKEVFPLRCEPSMCIAPVRWLLGRHRNDPRVSTKPTSLARRNPPFDFSAPEAPVYSRARFLPPSVIEGAQIKDSLVADGCKIGRGTVIENSVIGLRTNIGDNVTIRNSIIMELTTPKRLKV